MVQQSFDFLADRTIFKDTAEFYSPRSFHSRYLLRLCEDAAVDLNEISTFADTNNFNRINCNCRIIVLIALKYIEKKRLPPGRWISLYEDASLIRKLFSGGLYTFAMLRPIILLFFSNLFMTFAWYGHLKSMNNKPLFIVIGLSWGIAFFEYVLQVPANRIGFQYYNLGQLKIMQEVITMVVFAGFAFLYMKQPLKLDYLWAGLCLIGAVYFMFRGGLPQA